MCNLTMSNYGFPFFQNRPNIMATRIVPVPTNILRNSSTQNSTQQIIPFTNVNSGVVLASPVYTDRFVAQQNSTLEQLHQIDSNFFKYTKENFTSFQSVIKNYKKTIIDFKTSKENEIYLRNKLGLQQQICQSQAATIQNLNGKLHTFQNNTVEKSQFDAIQQQNVKFAQNFEALFVEHETIRLQLAECGKSLENANKIVSELEQEKLHWKNEFQTVKSDRDELVRQHEKLLQDFKVAEDQICKLNDTVDADVKKLNAEILHLKNTSLAQWKKTLAQLETNNKTELAERDKKFQEAETEIQSLKSEVLSLRTHVRVLNAEKLDLRQKMESLEAKSGETEDGLRERIETQSQNIMAKSKTIFKLKKRLAKYETKKPKRKRDEEVIGRNNFI
ncbi:unnamed protein product [Orchesella dallaii]|uniref:Uncharacterized protein n=1 Tax=Orchesella dallaii TaxID=48710 RepID=A0ABP1RI10_9HEXA